jgi:uncharacterized membrane protein (DUF4010 family)
VVTVTIVYPPLVSRLLIPFTVMGAVTVVLAGGMYWLGNRRKRKLEQREVVPIKNPFSLAAATRFGLLFALVLLVVKITERYAPTEGLYLVAALAGLTDVDAITLSMAEYARQSSAYSTAAIAVATAALSNTVVKCGMVLVLGSQALRSRILAATAAILVSGVLAVLLTR